MRLIHLFLAGLFLLLPLSAFPATPIEVDLSSGKQNLSPHLSSLYDLHDAYRLEDIVDTKNNTELEWASNTKRHQSLIRKPGVYWFKGELANSSANEITANLQIEYALVNAVSLYSVRDGNLTTLLTNVGLNYRFDNRLEQNRNLIVPVTLPPNSITTLIWHIDSKPVYQFRTTLWDPNYFHEKDQQHEMIFGMLYGILIVMTLYNMFLYFSTRQKSYVYYALYVITSFYVIAAKQGHVYQYIVPDTPWEKLTAYSIIFGINLFAFSQFSIYFLNLKRYSIRLMQFIRWIAVISAIGGIAIRYTNSQSLVILVASTSILLYCGALLAGITVRRRGVVSAGHFIIAILILVFSLATNNMASLGLIESTVLTGNLEAIGTVLMLVFFSLALADLINQLQKENKENNRNMAIVNDEKMKAHQAVLSAQIDRIKLEQLVTQAKNESRTKSKFMATMTKDIGPPLQNIFDIVEGLKKTSLSGPQVEQLNRIDQSKQSLKNVIGDLQDFTTLESGDIELSYTVFNLTTLIDDCFTTLVSRDANKSVSFVGDIQAELPTALYGDTAKLKQIIMNLLSSSAKLAGSNNVLLNVTNTEKPSVNSIELKFSIRNNDCGTSSEDQQARFNPFLQPEVYFASSEGDIGLAISKQYIELMDGSNGLECDEIAGSEIWFTARLLIDRPNDDSTKIHTETDNP